MKKLISVVVPMYFEEEVAEICHERLSKVMMSTNYNYELIFINDGSKDKTETILYEISLKDKNSKVLNFSRNFGHQNAVTAGIDKATGDAIIIIDADLQDPPELIPKMLEKWENGSDVVYAVRLKRKGESFFKKVTAKYFYSFLNYMTSTEIPKDTGDFRLIDKSVANAFRQMPESNRFIRGMISWVGFKQEPIMYERQERFAGETKYPLKKMLKFASDAIISFSVKPLKFIELLGALSVFISILVLIYALYGKFISHSNTVGWTSIVAIICFFSGIELISLGVIGEYIARIYEENKKRPLYIIKNELNFEENKQE